MVKLTPVHEQQRLYWSITDLNLKFSVQNITVFLQYKLTEIINHVDRGRPVKKSYKMNGISMILISFGMCEDLFLILLFKKFGKRHPKSLNVKGYGIKKSIYSRNQIEIK